MSHTPAPELLDDPFSSFADLDPSEQAEVVCSLFEDSLDKKGLFRQMAVFLSPDDRRELTQCLSTTRVDANGQSINQRALVRADGRSMLWLHHHAEPRAMPSELAAIFGVSKQRVSQILGARGRSNTDEALLRAFNAASQEELKTGWRNQGDIEALAQYRQDRLAALRLTPRVMTAQPSKTGRWRVYGHSFEIRKRDGAYFIVIQSLFGDDESQPRNTGEEALKDAIDFIRETAQVDISPLQWKAEYGEEYYGEPLSKNLIREGDL